MISDYPHIPEKTTTVAQKTGPSWWYVFLLFIPIIRNTLLIRQRADASDYTGIDIWAIIDIIAFLGAIYVMLSHWHEIPWQKIKNSCFKWWLIYYVFCLFSFLWRIEGSSVPYILYRALAMLVMSLYTFWLLNQFQDRIYAFQKIIKYIFITAVLGFLRPFQSGDFHTNSYSVVAAIVAIMLWTENWNVGGKKYVRMFILAILFLILGTSSGSNIAFACAALLLLVNRGKKISLLLCLLAIGIGFIVYYYAFDSVVAYLMPGKNVETVEGMTGRAQIWEHYISAWKKQPWLGYGFAVGERAGALFDYIYCLSAHNGFISLLINTGIIGIVIWGLFFIGFLAHLFQKVQQVVPFSPAIFYAFIVIIINNMTVPVIGSQWGALSQSVLFLIAYVVLFMDNKESELVSLQEIEQGKTLMQNKIL